MMLHRIKVSGLGPRRVRTREDEVLKKYEFGLLGMQIASRAKLVEDRARVGTSLNPPEVWSYCRCSKKPCTYIRFL